MGRKMGGDLLLDLYYIIKSSVACSPEVATLLHIDELYILYIILRELFQHLLADFGYINTET